MEIEVSAPNMLPPCVIDREKGVETFDKDRLRVKRKTLQAVLEQCQRALESLNDNNDDDDSSLPDLEDYREKQLSRQSSLDSLRDREADELCDLLKSRVECPDFLEKLESAQLSVPPDTTGMSSDSACFVGEECSSWDMVSENDLWEGEMGNSEQEDFVLVRQEDIVEGIAGFMAAYLLSLKQTKDLTPNQLQEALCKTFSVKKKKGKLRKAWDGSKVIYNVASWGATAIGIQDIPEPSDTKGSHKCVLDIMSHNLKASLMSRIGEEADVAVVVVVVVVVVGKRRMNRLQLAAWFSILCGD
ncbi:hypothetical protein LINPERHAP2_LOCUS37531 [Linum perenne]